MSSMIERLATKLLAADGTYDARANSYPAFLGGYAIAYAAEGISWSLTRQAPESDVTRIERWLLERSLNLRGNRVRPEPRHSRFDWFGSWVDADTGTLYLDCVEIRQDRDDALARAFERGELAIWSFSDNEEIRVSEPWCNHDAAAVVNGTCECGEVVR